MIANKRVAFLSPISAMRPTVWSKLYASYDGKDRLNGLSTMAFSCRWINPAGSRWKLKTSEQYRGKMIKRWNIKGLSLAKKKKQETREIGLFPPKARTYLILDLSYPYFLFSVASNLFCSAISMELLRPEMMFELINVPHRFWYWSYENTQPTQ